MVDHGSDAATVVANAVTDITKGVMQISAAGLKQLFLLMYEGKELKVGQTNIEKLIKAIDAGDRINDITIPEDHIDQLVELAKKHGITYAVADNLKGEMIVYFPESQSNRMKNILQDMQNEINQAEPEPEPEPEHPDEIKEEFAPEIKDSLYNEDITSEKTIVFFDGMDPNHHVHISQQPLRAGGCETRCYIRREDGITELTDATTAVMESYNYGQRLTFEVAGLYPESKIQGHIDKVCKEFEQQRKRAELIAAKENVIDNLISKNAGLEGTLVVVSNSKKPQNLITIYKHLEPGTSGDFKTVNEVLIYENGKLIKDASAKETIAGYEKYKVVEKHGKNALNQYEKIISGKAFKGKEAEEKEQGVTIGERKPLSEYEKEIEKIKETMPKPEKAQEEKNLVVGLNTIKEMDSKNER